MCRNESVGTKALVSSLEVRGSIANAKRPRIINDEDDDDDDFTDEEDTYSGDDVEEDFDSIDEEDGDQTISSRMMTMLTMK